MTQPFLVLVRDRADAGDLRARTRAAHLEWLAGSRLPVRLAGPMLADDGATPVGSLLVVEAGDLDEAQAWAAADPYARAGLFTSVDVRPYKVVIGGFSAG